MLDHPAQTAARLRASSDPTYTCFGATCLVGGSRCSIVSVMGKRVPHELAQTSTMAVKCMTAAEA